MGKTPKKDINLYPLVVAPKKNTMKKGALYVVLGAAAVVLLAGGFVGTKIYKDTQSELVTEMEQKADDSDLREKIKNADAVAADIAVEPAMPIPSFGSRSTPPGIITMILPQIL